jgi:hypothetical protein
MVVRTAISLDGLRLSTGTIPAMATISQTRESTTAIRVALVMESGRIKPVWFEQADKHSRDWAFIKEICSVSSHRQGSAKIINFAVTADENGYRLSLNTEAFTLTLGVVEESPLPPLSTDRWGFIKPE